MTSPHTRRARGVLAAAAAAAIALALVPPAVAANAQTGGEDSEEGRVVYRADFDDLDDGALPEGLEVLAGEWSVQDGELVGGTGAKALLPTGHLDDFVFEATMRFDAAANSARWGGLILDMSPADTSQWQHGVIRTGSTAANGVEFAQWVGGGWNVTDAGAAPYDAAIGTEVPVRIVVSGTRAQWYFDDTLVLETNALRRTADGVPGLIVNDATIAFDDIVITEIDALPLVDLRSPGENALVVGHRGNSSVSPENTLPAIEGAVRGGADFFEIDIDYTADDRIVVLHDDTLDRTTDASGPIREATYDEIADADAGSWFSPAYGGERLPVLEDVLEYMADSGAHLLLEYKAPWDEEHVAIAQELIDEYGVADRIIAQSFDFTTLASLQAVSPEIPRMVLGDYISDGVAIAERFDAIGVNPTGSAVIANPGFVQTMHDAGLATFTWTVNDPAQWAALTELGVDGIITDRPDRLYGWNARNGQVLEVPAEPEEPAAEPTVAVLSPADGAVFSPDDTIVVAVNATDEDEILLTLDGDPVDNGQIVAASDLAAGAHTVTAVARGEGGEATHEISFTVEDAPVEPAVPAWDASVTYDAGAVVTAGDRVFRALWWTRGETPGTSTTGAWAEVGASVSCEAGVIETWTESGVYDDGDRVVFGTDVFQATWWTRGGEPGSSTGPWESQGAC